jgi:hypothetical protein
MLLQSAEITQSMRARCVPRFRPAYGEWGIVDGKGWGIATRESGIREAGEREPKTGNAKRVARAPTANR